MPVTGEAPGVGKALLTAIWLECCCFALSHAAFVKPVSLNNRTFEIDGGETWPVMAGDGPGINQGHLFEVDNCFEVHVTIYQEGVSTFVD